MKPVAGAEGGLFLAQVDEMLARLTGVDDVLLRRLVRAWKESPPPAGPNSSRRRTVDSGQEA